AGIVRRLLLSHGELALALQLLLAAEAAVGFAFADQALGVFAIDLPLVALAIGRERAADIRPFVPIEAEPAGIVDELALVAHLAALQVGVFNAQDERSALLAREEPVEERGARVAYMNLSGGRWGKADSHLARNERLLHSKDVSREESWKGALRRPTIDCGDNRCCGQCYELSNRCATLRND